MGIFSNPFKKHSSKKQLEQLITEIAAIRQHSEILALAPGTTGYNWMGVNRATHALFPTCTLELSQYYSNSIFTPQEIDHLVQYINTQHFSKVIFSGFPSYFSEMIAACKAEVYVIYHGFFSEMAGNDSLQKQFKELIQLTKNKKIKGIAFNKKGIAESVEKLWQIKTHKIILPTPICSEPIVKEEKVQIGVLGNNQFRKNLVNQVVAAGLIPNSSVHVTSNELSKLLPPQVPITIHPSGVSHKEFLRILGGMHINLHLSYSESWGQLTTESLSMGVPCLVAYHSDVFDYDDELRKLFVVEDYDNSWAIKERIETVMNMGDLSATCKQYVEKLNKLSAQTLEQFLYS